MQFEHDIGARQRIGVVGEDDRGPTPATVEDGVEHGAPPFGIEVFGRFVEHEDRRIGEHGPGEEDPLALTPAEVGAVLAHGRVE